MAWWEDSFSTSTSNVINTSSTAVTNHDLIRWYRAAYSGNFPRGYNPVYKEQVLPDRHEDEREIL